MDIPIAKLIENGFDGHPSANRQRAWLRDTHFLTFSQLVSHISHATGRPVDSIILHGFMVIRIWSCTKQTLQHSQLLLFICGYVLRPLSSLSLCPAFQDHHLFLSNPCMPHLLILMKLEELLGSCDTFVGLIW